MRRVTVTNNGSERARDRADQLRRDRARAARRRPGPSRVRQPLRRDRVARVVYGDHRHPAPALGRRSRRSGASTWSAHGRGAGRAGDLRDRPGALPRPRALDAAIRSRSMRDGRCRGTTGAVLDPIFALRTRVRARRRASRRRWRSPRWSPPAASGRSSWPTATTTRTRPSGRSTWPGPRAQVELRELGLTPADAAASSRSSPAICSSPTPGSGRPQAELRRNRGSQPLLWATGSRATGRSCWPRSIRRTACRRCGSSSRRTATGAAAA